MITSDLLQFIEEELDYLTSLNSATYNADREKRVYAQAVKLGEEVGELNEAILAYYNNQRKSKTKDFSIEKEIADVIIVVLILARHLDIDVNQALQAKIAKIVERRSEQL
jgi:NTP pyrophosphatase (non-canonical NTP hydrolase)